MIVDLFKKCTIEGCNNVCAKRNGKKYRSVCSKHRNKTKRDKDKLEALQDINTVPSLPHEPVITNKTTANGTGGNNFTR